MRTDRGEVVRPRRDRLQDDPSRLLGEELLVEDAPAVLRSPRTDQCVSHRPQDGWPVLWQQRVSEVDLDAMRERPVRPNRVLGDVRLADHGRDGAESSVDLKHEKIAACPLGKPRGAATPDTESDARQELQLVEL